MGGRLQGKVAIVTGGGSGFGLAIAEKFAEEGAKVLITDVVPGNAPKVAAANPSIKFMKADVSSRADWEKALETSLKEFGRLDIVVNNAGILIVKVPPHKEEGRLMLVVDDGLH
jgi:NAD(P)-dependent dehydrogenase (short-subunit alcohol dehydrogenase family)